jgi:hypothetical protein
MGCVTHTSLFTRRPFAAKIRRAPSYRRSRHYRVELAANLPEPETTLTGESLTEHSQRVTFDKVNSVHVPRRRTE